MFRASLSAENRISSQLAALGCSAKFACAVAGVSPTRLSQAFAGDFDLEATEATSLENTLAKITALTQALHPIRIDLRDARWMRNILKHMEFNNITATEIGFAMRSVFGPTEGPQ